MSKATAPLHQKEPVEVVQVSDKDASWVPSTGGFLGTSKWQETPRQTQNTLERLHISFGLRTPLDPRGELENIAGERNVWTTSLNLQLPCSISERSST